MLSEIEYETIANLRYHSRKFRHSSAGGCRSSWTFAAEASGFLAVKGFGSVGEMNISALAEKPLLAPAEAAELMTALQERGPLFD